MPPVAALSITPLKVAFPATWQAHNIILIPSTCNIIPQNPLRHLTKMIHILGTGLNKSIYVAKSRNAFDSL